MSEQTEQLAALDALRQCYGEAASRYDEVEPADLTFDTHAEFDREIGVLETFVYERSAEFDAARKRLICSGFEPVPDEWLTYQITDRVHTYPLQRRLVVTPPDHRQLERITDAIQWACWKLANQPPDAGGGEFDGQTDTLTDTAKKPKKRRRITEAARKCGEYVREKLEEDSTITRMEAVEDWLLDNEGPTPASLYRTLTDHPKLWKPGAERTPNGHETDTD